jgi:hypothetical protein
MREISVGGADHAFEAIGFGDTVRRLRLIGLHSAYRGLSHDH